MFTLSEMKTCASCGAAIARDARFCSSCGADLAAQGVAQTSRKTVSVLFVDLVDSTKIAESLDPESFRRLLEQYFSAMGRLIDQHGGKTEKFLGDAICAVFGIPTLHEDDALRAVSCGIAMREELLALNQSLSRTFSLSLETRSGITTGEVVARAQVNGTLPVLGRTMSLAARLQQAAEVGDILIDEVTRDLVADQFHLDKVDLNPKGFSNPVPAWRVRERMNRESLRSTDSRMVNRSREVAEIINWATPAGKKELKRPLLISGPPGIGKSRLLLEIDRKLPRNTKLLIGGCAAYGEASAYAPLGQLVNQLLEIPCVVSGDSLLTFLEERLNSLDNFTAVVPRIAALVGAEGTLGAPNEVAWALSRLFEWASRHASLVVGIEDLHWAEKPLLDAVVALLAEESSNPPPLLLTARPEFDARGVFGDRANTFQKVRLEPLDSEEGFELVKSIGEHLSIDDAHRIVESGAGNPLFLEQLVAAALQQDDSVPTIPRSITTLLAARIDSLDFVEKTTIQVASVIGERIDEVALKHLCSESASEIINALGALLEKGFLREVERSRSLAFGHALVRDAAYRSMSKERRSEIHEAAAKWLERDAAGHGLPVLCAYHFEQAFKYRNEIGTLDAKADALRERAAHWLGIAGEKAYEQGDAPSAIDLLQRSVAFLDRDDHRRLQQLFMVTDELLNVGDLHLARRYLEELLDDSQRLGDERMAARARSLDILSRTKRASGTELGMVESEIRQLADDFMRLDDPVGVADQLGFLAHLKILQEQFSDAIDLVKERLSWVERDGNLRELVQTRYQLAEYHVLGPTHLDECRPACSELIESAVDEGRRIDEGHACNLLACVSVLTGSPKEGARLAQRARDSFNEVGLPPSGWRHFHHWRGLSLLMTENTSEALHDLAQAQTITADMGMYWRSAEIALLVAECHVELGDVDAADAMVAFAEAKRVKSDRGTDAHARSLRGYLLAKRGVADSARSLISSAVEGLGEGLLTNCLVWLDAVRAYDLMRDETKTAAAIDTLRQLVMRKGNIVLLDKVDRTAAERS